MHDTRVRICDTQAYEAACDEVGLLMQSWSRRHGGDEPLMITAMIATAAVFYASLHGDDVVTEDRVQDVRNAMLIAAQRAARGQK